MRTTCLALAWLLCLCAPALGQSTACIPSTAPERAVIGQARLSFVVSPDHTLNDPAGQPVLTDYFAEVRVQGQPDVVTNFTIPKASLAPVPGGPSGCHDLLLPVMQGLLPSQTYTLTVVARGPGGQTSATVSGPFFLAGAPRGPGNTRVFTPGS